MTDLHPTCESARDLMGHLIASDTVAPELADARRHLNDCESCREYLADLLDDDDRLGALAHFHADQVRTLRLRTIAALPGEPEVEKTDPSRGARRWLTPRPLGGLAGLAAAVVFLLLAFPVSGPRFTAWAQVLETVREAATAQFRLRDMSGSDIEARQAYSERGTSHRTFERGELVEAMFVDFEQGQLLYFAYPLRMAARMSIAPELVDDFLQHDPARTFEFMNDYHYVELGNRRIDGRRASGIRVDDARFLAERMEHAELELWVDPETRLPIRFDVKGDSPGVNRPRHIRFHDFRWNEPLPDDEFNPAIPRDFRLIDGGDLKVDEEHCLAGLKLFAEVVGRYPGTLAYESLKVELWRSPGARGRDVGEMVVDMFKIRLASTFYGNLIREERAVVYFGPDVRPGQADRLLMRWQTGPDQYRAVFGDLRAETVSGQELLELEGR